MENCIKYNVSVQTFKKFWKFRATVPQFPSAQKDLGPNIVSLFPSKGLYYVYRIIFLPREM